MDVIPILMSILSFLFRSDTSTVITCTVTGLTLMVGFAYWMGAEDRRYRRTGKHRK